jgi:hypothetical protein
MGALTSDQAPAREFEPKKRLDARFGVKLESTTNSQLRHPSGSSPMTPSAFRLSRKDDRDATRPSVAWALMLLMLGACHVHPWRSSSGPLASVAAAGKPLRVTTRMSVDGRVDYYVFSSARVEGDSLVGLVYEQYQRIGDGPWSPLQRSERDPRVSVATADVADVSRREREASLGRTSVLLVVIAAALIGGYYGFLAYAFAGGS